MSKPVLFISDLHLEESRPDITASLLAFLKQHAGNCDSLFILGDLFEVWIGDDDSSPLTEEVAAALAEFNQQGSEIFLMHGNRDFLMGEQFAASCGATLISEPYLLDRPWGTALLIHGDSLCTDDTGYMEFRSMVRNPAWQEEFLAQPIEARQAFARQAREESQQATAEKQSEIMDVNQTAVLELLHTAQQTTLIHGHTHRPAVHDFPLDEEISGSDVATRLVLGDWDKTGWSAAFTEEGLELDEFPLSQMD